MTRAPEKRGPPPIVVVGGGITGLSAAWAAREAGARVLLLEAQERTGGVIRSERDEGYLAELGPTSMMETPDVRRLIAALSLGEERVVPSPAASRRYVIRSGRMVSLPTTPAAFVRSHVLSTRGKVRALLEPFVRRAREDAPEESLAALVERRFGREVLDYLVDPFASGVYAGDSARLSSWHAMKPLREHERASGSVILGAIGELRRARAASAGMSPRRATMCSFRSGLATLPAAMTTSLGAAVKTSAPVDSIAWAGDSWLVRHADAAHPAGGTVVAAAVVLTVPGHALRTIDLPDALRRAAAPLSDVRSAPVATISLGFRRSDVAHALDGFGVLAPRVERQPVLGILFNSTLFARRAPDNAVMLTVFVGGAARPEGLDCDDDALLASVRAALGPLLGVTAAPVYHRITRWPRGIPQYELGHDRVLASVARCEAQYPGLLFAGSSIAGVSIGDCVTAGLRAGRRAAAHACSFAHSTPTVT